MYKIMGTNARVEGRRVKWCAGVLACGLSEVGENDAVFAAIV